MNDNQGGQTNITSDISLSQLNISLDLPVLRAKPLIDGNAEVEAVILFNTSARIQHCKLGG